jgi:hypothetical protein
MKKKSNRHEKQAWQEVLNGAGWYSSVKLGCGDEDIAEAENKLKVAIIDWATVVLNDGVPL